MITTGNEAQNAKISTKLTRLICTETGPLMRFLLQGSSYKVPLTRFLLWGSSFKVLLTRFISSDFVRTTRLCASVWCRSPSAPDVFVLPPVPGRANCSSLVCSTSPALLSVGLESRLAGSGVICLRSFAQAGSVVVCLCDEADWKAAGLNEIVRNGCIADCWPNNLTEDLENDRIETNDCRRNRGLVCRMTIWRCPSEASCSAMNRCLTASHCWSCFPLPRRR